MRLRSFAEGTQATSSTKAFKESTIRYAEWGVTSSFKSHPLGKMAEYADFGTCFDDQRLYGTRCLCWSYLSPYAMEWYEMEGHATFIYSRCSRATRSPHIARASWFFTYNITTKMYPIGAHMWKRLANIAFKLCIPIWTELSQLFITWPCLSQRSQSTTCLSILKMDLKLSYIWHVSLQAVVQVFILRNWKPDSVALPAST